MAEPLGIIGGSSLISSSLFASLDKVIVNTQFGDVLLYHSSHPARFGKPLYFCQRHHADPHKEYTLPHAINKRAIAVAFTKVGVKKVVGFASVGGMKTDLHPGLVVIPDDYFNPWAIMSIVENQDAFKVPSYDSQIRNKIVEILKREDVKFRDGGVYVQSMGPRFETKAEIRFMSTVGDVVGMTGADEATLLQDVKIQYASVCMIDNYANGVHADKQLEFSDFEEGVKRNMLVVESIAKWVVKEI